MSPKTIVSTTVESVQNQIFRLDIIHIKVQVAKIAFFYVTNQLDLTL